MRFGPRDERRGRTVYRDIIRLKRRGARIVNSTAFLRKSPDYLINGSASWPCRAGEQFLSVSPDGLISPCHAFEGEWGIDHREFEQRFATAEYRTEVRQRAAGCEGCFRPCWAEIGLLMGRPDSLLEMARSQLSARRRRPGYPTW